MLMAAKYPVINPETDVNWSEALWAQKTAPITAVWVMPGVEVETVLADGRVEATRVVGEDGGYRVTNITGEQYLVEPETLSNRYNREGQSEVYKPKYNPVEIIRLEQNASFLDKMRDMHMEIDAGGYLVRLDTGEIYGIEPDLFEKTYAILPQIQTDPMQANQFKPSF